MQTQNAEMNAKRKLEALKGISVYFSNSKIMVPTAKSYIAKETCLRCHNLRKLWPVCSYVICQSFRGVTLPIYWYFGAIEHDVTKVV